MVPDGCVCLGVARTDGEAADELMKALRRKHSSILDTLVECLKEQEDANADIIRKIREGECQCVISRMMYD